MSMKGRVGNKIMLNVLECNLKITAGCYANPILKDQ